MVDDGRADEVNRQALAPGGSLERGGVRGRRGIEAQEELAHGWGSHSAEAAARGKDGSCWRVQGWSCRTLGETLAARIGLGRRAHSLVQSCTRLHWAGQTLGGLACQGSLLP